MNSFLVFDLSETNLANSTFSLQYACRINTDGEVCGKKNAVARNKRKNKTEKKVSLRIKLKEILDLKKKEI